MYTISKRSFRDDSALMQLFTQTIHNVCQNAYTSEELHAWAPLKRDFHAFSRSFSGSHCLVARENKQIIGFCDMEKDGYINRLFVHHTRQGEGIGSALLQKMLAFAQKKGLDYVYLEASRNAVSFYKKHGFIENGCIRRIKNGVPFVNQKMIYYFYQ